MAEAPITTLAQFEATLSRTFELGGLGGADWNESTLIPRLESPNTDVHALVAALPRLHTRPDGQLVADLVLERTLGEGGMGVVRLAEQSSLGRQVAVKSLRADRTSPEAVLQLLREAWVTGRLEHPNIVPIYTLGVNGEGRPMIVMKRIEGTPWSAYVRGRAEPPNLGSSLRKQEWNLRVLMQVANAVELAGAKGIVHRDLKPDNVMIGRFGEVYVLDWGIAVSLDETAEGRLPLAAKAHGIAGTPGYMAPEMIEEGAVRLTPQTDVYLLGAILHELLVGAPRHTGRSVLECLFSAYRSTPFEYGPDVPIELAAIANRATARDPSDRHADAEAFRRAIEDFLGHETSRELAAEAVTRLTELERLLEGSAPSVREDSVYKVFGECRFGFLQALRTWPDSPGARPGLDRALALMIGHELARENVSAAAALLSELTTPSPELAARIEAERQRLEARAARLAKLEADRDLDVGLRTRAFLSLLLAFFWSALPLVLGLARDLWGHAPSYRDYLAGFAAVSAGGLALTWWARDSLTRTAVNRQITGAVYISWVGVLMSKLAGVWLGLPIEHTAVIDLAVVTVAVLTNALATDPRLVVAGLFPLAGFFAVILDLDRAFYWLAAAEFASFLSAAVIWRPRTWAALRAPSPAKLARMARRARQQVDEERTP